MADDDLPGGAIARRALHFIFIADCSSSMAGAGKIQSLNHAIREAIPHMRKVASGNPNAEVLARSIAFSDRALWHQPTPTNVEQYEWTDLQASHVGTDMGGALRLAAEAMRALPHGEQARMFPPVLVLISDGAPSSKSEFDAGLRELLSDPWGARAVRIAIAIGHGAGQGPAAEILGRFIANVELKLLEANNAQDLVNYIRFASTAVLELASRPRGDPGDPHALMTPPPPPPTPQGPNAPW